ncbi:MAG: hypothetical protein SWH54_13210 [Thermodesulfobacteriota bacterium]|nr:hypothetical protein [Thermodesulfobacteriota bacterium]
MKIESKGAFTNITGKVLDQPALHGLIVRIRDLGLPLISVMTMDIVGELYGKERLEDFFKQESLS